jgi:hypothetical protein
MKKELSLRAQLSNPVSQKGILNKYIWIATSRHDSLAAKGRCNDICRTLWLIMKIIQMNDV